MPNYSTNPDLAGFCVSFGPKNERTVITAIGQDIEKAAGHLLAGEVVAIPTETVYGLAANALNETAVTRIFTTKQRPQTNPLIIHLPGIETIDRYVTDIPPVAQQLAAAFWPGPLTMILPKKSIVPDLVTAGLPEVAVRVPDHPLTLNLLQQLDTPLAAPSANPFGYISPTTPAHVQNQLDGKIPYILDGGPCRQGLESTIVGFRDGHPIVFRLGAIPLEQLEEVVGTTLRVQNLEHKTPVGPGMLPFHYSPHTSLLLLERVEAAFADYSTDKIGIISLSRSFEQIPAAHQVQLSPTEDLSEAGQRLYFAMHQLDAMGLDVILVEKLPDTGLGKTMNDRLARAAAKRE